jgi:ABC-type polysaccharide/polyol phosphate export permease
LKQVFFRSISDWANALRTWRLWTALAREDLSDRYRRTVLGVSWLVTSFALFIAVYILVFGRGSGVSQAEYALYVTIGFGLWNFISGAVGDGCVAYSASGNWILGTSIPYPAFIFQTVYRNYLVFLLNLFVIAIALLWLKSEWSPAMLWALPGLLVYMITPLWLAAILAPLCARYRDGLHAVQTGMRLLFFATPILWLPTQRSQLALLAHYNPLSYFIDIVRVPLIYDAFPYTSWIVVLTINGVGLLAGAATYALTRHRVAYWL